MLVELLTPFMLATAPATIDLNTVATYSHDTQSSAVAGDGFDPIAQSQTMTWNGTQTFDWQGKPSDSDGDKD
jgi:hypothetical protein